MSRTMTFVIKDGDKVEYDNQQRPIKIDKATTVIRIKYKEDGSVWMADYLKKTK